MNKITYFGNVAQKREMEYPPFQRQMEMLWKALGEVRADGVSFSRDIIDMMDRIEAVQQKYPDPPTEGA